MPPKFKRPPPPQASASGGLSFDDEDAFFSRNNKGWGAIKAENIASPTKSARDSSDSDDNPAPKRHKGKGKPLKKESDWTKPGAVIVLDSDDEIEIMDDEPRRKSTSPGKGKGKAKAAKTRERSITPPPQVPEDKMMEARRLVKEALSLPGANDYNYAMELAMADEDEKELEDPDVIELLAGARKAEQSKSTSFAYDAQSPTYDDHSPPPKSPENDDQKLKLRVMWKGPPLDEGKAKWAFAFNLQAPFRRLNEMMQTKTRLSEREIILAHNSHRILLGATPKSLRMRKDTTETIDVYPKWQWDAEGHDTGTPLTSPRVEDMAPAPAAPLTTGTQAEDEENDGETRDDILVLSIRSLAYPNPILISAKRTAKSASVLIKYLQKVGEDATAFDVAGDGKQRGKKRVKLSFDGEELAGAAPVGGVDADNDDVWDVVGL